MSLLQRLISATDPLPEPGPLPELHARGAIDAAISAAISERQANFTVADAIRLPSMRRALDLIVSIGASFTPMVYRDGTALERAPRVISRPDPFRSRAAFVGQTLDSLVRKGEAFWRLGTRDPNTGHVRSAVVLPPDEVEVSWDDRRFGPLYRWRDRDMIAGVDLMHITIGQAAGELHGTSPIESALPYLATIDAAERFAANWFGAGGVPLTVLKTDATLTRKQASDLKAQYAQSRAEANAAGEPAVASGGVSLEFPGNDPAEAQLDSSRDAGNTVIGRLMGIPAPLLHINLEGASLQYQNVGAVVSNFAKATVVPLYLVPIEAALSDLVARNMAVRFSLGELQRADVADRADVYARFIDMGALDAEEVRLAEGWGPRPHDVTPVPPVNAPLPTRARATVSV